MIETLFSLFITTFVLLSLLSYEIAAEKNTYHNCLKTIATTQLNNLAEIISSTTDNTRRNQWVSQWNEWNAQLLPHSNGTFHEMKSHDCQLQVQWVDYRPEKVSQSLCC